MRKFCCVVFGVLGASGCLPDEAGLSGASDGQEARASKCQKNPTAKGCVPAPTTNAGDCGITGLVIPSTIVRGDASTVGMIVANLGAIDTYCTGSLDITYTYDGGGAGSFGTTTSGDYPVGYSFQASVGVFTPAYDFESVVGYSVTACAYSKSPDRSDPFGIDENEANRCITADLVVEEPPPTVSDCALTAIEVPANAKLGDDSTVTFEVTNLGDAETSCRVQNRVDQMVGDSAVFGTSGDNTVPLVPGASLRFATSVFPSGYYDPWTEEIVATGCAWAVDASRASIDEDPSNECQEVAFTAH